MEGYFATRSGLIVRCKAPPPVGGVPRKDGRPKKAPNRPWIKIYATRGHHRTGHHYLNLWIDGSHTTHLVPRLVALAHYGDPPDDAPIVAHENGDPNDNRAPNLRWSSHRDNVLDREFHRRHRGLARPRFDENGMLVDQPEPTRRRWWQVAADLEAAREAEVEYVPDADLGF